MTSPDDPQPLYPTGNDFTTHRRLTPGHTRFRPVGGAAPRATKPRKPRAGATARQPRTGGQRRVHSAAPRHAARHAPHSAHRTAARPLPQTKQQHGPKVDSQFWQLEDQNEQMLAILIPRALGAGYGYSHGHISAPGHHPQATGRPRQSPEGAHLGTIRRAQILSYNSSTGYAVVRDADSPDSPGIAVRVSPAVSSAAMSSATMAGIALWDTGDPTDALVSTIL